MHGHHVTNTRSTYSENYANDYTEADMKKGIQGER